MGSITHIEKRNIENSRLKGLAGIVYEAFGAKITALGIQKEVAIEIITNSIAPDSAFFAYQGNRLVGVVGIVKIEALAVSGEMRGRGIGTKKDQMKARPIGPTSGVSVMR